MKRARQATNDPTPSTHMAILSKLNKIEESINKLSTGWYS